MNVAEFLIEQLSVCNVTDVFGIPGGVVLDFLQAIKKKDGMNGHLLFNEQDAAYAAVGYAQAGQRLGVAFATKGPGILNMITTITDAYHDSVPILVITAHGTKDFPLDMRVMDEQEINLRRVFSSVVKEVVVIDELDSARVKIIEACNLALENRQGPVLLDFYAKIWGKELPDNTSDINIIQAEIIRYMKEADKPVILLGDGVRQAGIGRAVRKFAEKNKIPVLTSRGSQDIMVDSDVYYGYIGSHGIRYANFVLSKTDCILSLGNRLAFPVKSESFGKVFEHAKLIRLEIDRNEFERYISSGISYLTDLKEYKYFFESTNINSDKSKWLSICNKLRKYLWMYDMEEPVETIAGIIKRLSFAPVMVSDVGNNEFWVSRAYVYAKVKSSMQYSRSLGVLGNSLGKAIGAYYSCKHSIVCFCGDQGAQYNISELQYVGVNHLPIWIVVINNHSSGMIKSRQSQKYNCEYILTTESTGYSVVDFSQIAKAYKIDYKQIGIGQDIGEIQELDQQRPHLIELVVPEEIELNPHLPIGNNIQDMYPSLDPNLYKRLDNL